MKAGEDRRPSGTYELACRELHPMGCQARIRGASVEMMLHAAVSHGSRGHGFTSSFYDPDRLGTMRAVLSGVVGTEQTPPVPGRSSER